MKILALDASFTSTGYAVLNSKMDVIECGKVTPKEKLPDSKRISEICEKCEELIVKYSISKVVIEEQYVKRNMNTALKLSRLFGAIMYLTNIMDVELIPIEASKIRKILLGDGKADKEEIAEYVLYTYKNSDIVKAIGPYSDKKNKKKTSDIYDAISIGMSYIVGEKCGEVLQPI